MAIAKFVKAYIRHYSDNGQTTAYVEWRDETGAKCRTEGKEYDMRHLMTAARSRGVPVARETWRTP